MKKRPHAVRNEENSEFLSHGSYQQRQPWSSFPEWLRISRLVFCLAKDDEARGSERMMEANSDCPDSILRSEDARLTPSDHENRHTEIIIWFSSSITQILLHRRYPKSDCWLLYEHKDVRMLQECEFLHAVQRSRWTEMVDARQCLCLLLFCFARQ